MSAGQLGALFGAFGLSLLLGIVAKWIAEIARAALGTRYVIACAAAFLPVLLAIVLMFTSPDPLRDVGYVAISFLGALAAIGVLLWWYQGDNAAEAKRSRSAAEKQGM